MSMNLFEKATKQRIRWSSAAGQLTVEDLWTLPLTGKVSLETLAKDVNRQLKESEEESFVKPASSGSTKLHDQLEILKHIIAVKLDERDKQAAAKANKDQLEFLKGALAQKQQAAVLEKSPEELAAMIKALEG